MPCIRRLPESAVFPMPLFVNFRSVVHALSDSLDLVGIDDVHHGKRVGIMAVEILRELGWSQEDREMVFDACLLHDIGVSTSDLHRQLVEEFDWIGSQTHAKLGAFLLSKFPPLAHLAPAIRLHHTHWAELKDRYGKTERIANLIFLADRVDVLAGAAILNDELLEGVPAIRAKVLEQAGSMFDPELVAAFVSVSRKEARRLRQAGAGGLSARPGKTADSGCRARQARTADQPRAPANHQPRLRDLPDPGAHPGLRGHRAMGFLSS